MGATLEALLEFQDIELQIVDIRRQVERRHRAVTFQEGKLGSARAALDAERGELMRSQAQVDELDLDLKARTANVDRFREHLNTVRTNKEYAAVLTQLNNEKADASRLESRALELMQCVDIRRNALAEQENGERAVAQRIEELKEQLRQTEASFADRLANLEQRRRDAGANLPSDVLSLFERVSDRYEGEALAPVTRVHPRRDEFICGGCHMSLAAERANALMTRDDVFTCNNCGRILHIEKGT